MNKRIKNKINKRDKGLTAPQIKIIKGLMSPSKFKKFMNDWYWWDYAYIVDLIYYTQENSTVTLKQLSGLEDSLDGVDYINPKMSVHEINNLLWEKSQPYYDLVSKLDRKSAYLYGVILKYTARAYNVHGVSYDAGKTAKELIKASEMLKGNQLDAYINYAQENLRLNSWWD